VVDDAKGRENWRCRDMYIGWNLPGRDQASVNTPQDWEIDGEGRGGRRRLNMERTSPLGMDVIMGLGQETGKE